MVVCAEVDLQPVTNIGTVGTITANANVSQRTRIRFFMLSVECWTEHLPPKQQDKDEVQTPRPGLKRWWSRWLSRPKVEYHGEDAQNPKEETYCHRMQAYPTLGGEATGGLTPKGLDGRAVATFARVVVSPVATAVAVVCMA